eukprot:968362_1
MQTTPTYWIIKAMFIFKIRTVVHLWDQGRSRCPVHQTWPSITSDVLRNKNTDRKEAFQVALERNAVCKAKTEMTRINQIINKTVRECDCNTLVSRWNKRCVAILE